MVSHGDEAMACDGLADVVYFVEKMMTIELQRRRADLFFMHAAAVSINNRAVLLVGESGAGKSSTCWHLINNGFGYLSDELAPIALDTLNVEPYPHAVCLKQETHCDPPVPDNTLRTDRTSHVPVESIPSTVTEAVVPLAAVVFLTGVVDEAGFGIEPMAAGQAAARLYANGLNQLAHEGSGLTAVSGLAQRVPCYSLSRSGLEQMGRAIAGLPEVAA